MTSISDTTFKNIEKVATYIVAANKDDLDKRIEQLEAAGFSEYEIDIGSKMAIQAVFTVMFLGGDKALLNQDLPEA